MAKYKIAPSRFSKQIILSTDQYGEAQDEVYFIGKGTDVISFEERFESGKLNTPEKGYALFLFNRIVCLLGLRSEYTNSSNREPVTTADGAAIPNPPF